MLRIAVPNKGALAQDAAQMLAEAGYQGRRDSRTLVVTDKRNNAEFFYLRPRDIATYVGSGAIDVGITGSDLLLDSHSAARSIKKLHFANSTFRFAAPANTINNLSNLQGKRLATSYPKLVGDFLQTHGVTAQLVKLEGAVESAVRLGIADAVADVVSTGATLRAAGLEIFGPQIHNSTAVLIASPQLQSTDNPGIKRLLQRLDGVLVARNYVMMEYDLRAADLAAATAICAGAQSPTVSPLADPDWIAVKVMAPIDQVAQIMDQLADLGAKAIIVTAIHAARL